MKKVISMILVLVLVLIFAFPALKSYGKKDSSKDSLTVGIVPGIDDVPLWIAEKENLFKNNGLDVNIMTYRNTQDRDEAFKKGYIDGIVTDMVNVALLRKDGIDVKITGITDSNYRLIAGKKGDLFILDDLKWTKTVLPKNSAEEYIFDTVMENYNIPAYSITKDYMSQVPIRVSMLKRKVSDTALLEEPSSSLAINNGGYTLLDSKNINIKLGVTAFSKKSIDEKKDSLTKFYKVYDEAVDIANKDSLSKYKHLIIKKLGYTEQIINSISLPEYRKNTLPSTEDMDKILNWMKNKYILDMELKSNDFFYQ